MSVSTITYQVAQNNGATRPYTVMTENPNFINSIITVNENNTISAADQKKLNQFASRNGDYGVVEECDMTIQDKINYAKSRGFDKFYDMKLSSDGKYLQVTIKDTSWLTRDPDLGNIKKDFGVKDDVFVNGADFPHGNENLLSNKYVPNNINTNYTDYDAIKLEAGETINIPVAEVHINNNPRNCFARWFN